MSKLKISPEEFQEIIKMFLELDQLGFNKSFLARRFGVSQSAMWYYSQGQRKMPQELKEKLKKFLDIQKKIK